MFSDHHAYLCDFKVPVIFLTTNLLHVCGYIAYARDEFNPTSIDQFNSASIPELDYCGRNNLNSKKDFNCINVNVNELGLLAWK